MWNAHYVHSVYRYVRITIFIVYWRLVSVLAIVILTNARWSITNVERLYNIYNIVYLPTNYLHHDPRTSPIRFVRFFNINEFWLNTHFSLLRSLKFKNISVYVSSKTEDWTWSPLLIRRTWNRLKKYTSSWY